MVMVLVMVLVELAEAWLAVVVTTELALVLADLGLVELVEAGLAVVVTMDSLSTTVASNSAPSTPSSTSVCSTSDCSTSDCSTSTSTSEVGAAVPREVVGPGPDAGDGVPREVVSPGPDAGDGVPREVVSPGPDAGDGVPREVVSPDPDALLSTCFFLGNTKVPSNCERTLDNSDWLKYEPVKWTLATTMRMAVFISATC